MKNTFRPEEEKWIFGIIEKISTTARKMNHIKEWEALRIREWLEMKCEEPELEPIKKHSLWDCDDEYPDLEPDEENKDINVLLSAPTLRNPNVQPGVSSFKRHRDNKRGIIK
jgi:hypothetical protein